MTYTTRQRLQALFNKQRAAFAKNPMPTVSERQQRLMGLREAIVEFRDPIRRAVGEDYGTRSPLVTDLFECGGVLGRADFIRNHLEEWMAPEERPLDAATHGSSRLEVVHQPKGVLGNISPWNLPVDSALVMVADMLGAGNRVIVKLSEFAPRTAVVLQRAVAAHLPDDVLSLVTGDAEFGAHFSTLPWNHLTFTGSTRVGRLVMQAAAANLTPVTLELGGKNPVLFAPDGASVESFVERVLFFRSFNAGQVCTSPDYALVPEKHLQQWIELAKRTWIAMYPKYVGHPDANSIITRAHYDRLLNLVKEAQDRGVPVVVLGDEKPSAELRQIPMTLLIDPPDDLQCMQEEIFGPIFPVKSYQSIDSAFERIKAGPNPLAAYVVTRDMGLAKRFTHEILSGGTGVNTFGFQCIEPIAPFGGVGLSGTGCHSGKEGFLNYSHTKTVFYQSDDNPLSAMLKPPFGKEMRELADSIYA